jgi:glycosyltransferase involved in cell wall biosynthesis
MTPDAILHIVPSINPAIGGPARSVPRLVESLAFHSTPCCLLTLDYREHGIPPKLPPGMLTAVAPNVLTRLSRGWSPSLARCADQLGSKAALVHNHGLWMHPNHVAARVASRHHLPLVISPRGMLGSWALGRNRLVKRLFFQLRERTHLESATAFHATSFAEADDIRHAGFRQPIAVIPNGVDLPSQPAPDRAFLDDALPQTSGKRIALFLSRLHPKKGLVELLIAWAGQSAVDRTGWHLVISGPDLTGYGSTVKSLIRQDPDPSSISLTGGVEGDLKKALLHHAEFFVLPTKEENFGIVVAESLAAGTPVITTHAAPWKVLETLRCGWWIPGTDEALFEALTQALGSPPADLQRMGCRGREYVGGELDWNTIARKMASFYHWLLHQGPRPDFVMID